MTEDDKQELIEKVLLLLKRDGVGGQNPDCWSLNIESEILLFNYAGIVRVRFRQLSRAPGNELWSTIVQVEPDGKARWGFVTKGPIVLDILRRRLILDDLADV